MDKYDKEIEELMAIPPEDFQKEVNNHWMQPTPLFQYMTNTGQHGGGCGCRCPTMIKYNPDYGGPTETVKASRNLA